MTKVSTLAKAAALSAAILLPAVGARAAIQVVSNFGPGKTFDLNSFSHVLGPEYEFPPSAQTQYLATSFTTTFGISLDHIDLALVDNKCGVTHAAGVSVDLVVDAGGAPSKTAGIIKHWLVTKIPCSAGIIKLAIPATQSLPLPASTKYWVVVMPIGFNDWTFWHLGMTTLETSIESQDGAKTWIPMVPNHGTTETLSLDVWRR